MGENEWTRVLLERRADAAFQLAQKAEGLFIYAKVVVDFLTRRRQLAQHYFDALIAESSESNVHQDAALAPLDVLYTAVLESAFPDIRTDRCLQAQMQDVLGCVAILQDHVSPRVLHSLVGIEVAAVELVVDYLRAIIIFDKTCKTSDAKIHPLHASFPQFLLDENRCMNKLFWVNSCAQNSRWAAACLSTLNDPGLLQRNVCRLPDPLLHKDEVSDLSTRIKTYLPVHTGIQYACLHWATHLCGSGSQDVSVLMQSLDKFCRERLLFWMEALSMIGRLDVAVTALINARDWHASHSSTQDDTYWLLNDAYRFVLEYYIPINCCPEQIYISALTFAPSCVSETSMLKWSIPLWLSEFIVNHAGDHACGYARLPTTSTSCDFPQTDVA
ncbi:hypothetical protein A0H81_05795 [Grifola frondosa]|uniref:Uncharacterized protein n=1 Tax=Grifola frondosa TaxID=5627 RepID=A0A1C7MD74_GRIFR|nr:hypothetical protein A0H81_05795 [Grifola frondosa]